MRHSRALDQTMPNMAMRRQGNEPDCSQEKGWLESRGIQIQTRAFSSGPATGSNVVLQQQNMSDKDITQSSTENTLSKELGWMGSAAAEGTRHRAERNAFEESDKVPQRTQCQKICSCRRSQKCRSVSQLPTRSLQQSATAATA